MSRGDGRVHDRALELAAVVIDAGSIGNRAAELERHLLACPACAVSAAALRADAVSLRRAAPRLPSRRVDEAIRAEIAGRSVRPQGLSLVAAVALLLLVLLLGVAAAGAALFLTHPKPADVQPTARPAVIVVPPSPRASPSPTPEPSPSTPPASLPAASPTVAAAASPAPLDPATATWTRLGPVTVPGGGSVAGIVGFDSGYVALGANDSAGPIALFSADGVRWTATELANQVPNCPGRGTGAGGTVPDADAGAIATNGREIVIVGAESPHGAAACADVASSIRPVAWRSPDGRTWTRSTPFEVGATNGRASAVWALPGGWQAAVEGPATGTIAIWDSADGLTWSRLQPVEAVGAMNVYAGSSAAGTVVLSHSTADASGLRLFVADGGRGWRPIATAGGCEAGATQILGPATVGMHDWVILADMRICVSPDLATWTTRTLGMWPAAIAQTRFGAVAVGDSCYGAGSSCPDPGVRAFLSTDGATWARIPHPAVYWGRALADGPAGVLLLGTGPADTVTTAWRLNP